MARTKSETETTEPAEPVKRPDPPVVVGPACQPRPQAMNQARSLEVMCHDLGLYDGRITGHYGNALVNSVCELQKILIANGSYQGVPHGRFDEATREALLADPNIPTILE